MKKPTPRQTRICSNCLLVGGVLLGYLGTQWSVSVLMGIGMAAIVGGLVLDVLFYVCPHCGKHLGRTRCDFCKSCGERVDT